MTQRISQLNEAERAWVDDNVAAARRYVEDAGHPIQGNRPLDPAALDAAWAFWLRAWPAGEEDPNPVINALGMAMGQYLGAKRLDTRTVGFFVPVAGQIERQVAGLRASQARG